VWSSGRLSSMAAFSTNFRTGRRWPRWPLDHLLRDRPVFRRLKVRGCRASNSPGIRSHARACLPLRHVHSLTVCCLHCMLVQARDATVRRSAAQPQWRRNRRADGATGRQRIRRRRDGRSAARWVLGVKQQPRPYSPPHPHTHTHTHPHMHTLTHFTLLSTLALTVGTAAHCHSLCGDRGRPGGVCRCASRVGLLRLL